MRRLTIKNVGAIRLVEFDINRINVFMGPQSSGKSTISKILCHCQWVEKSCFMNPKEIENYQRPGTFFDSLVEYHKMEGYFNKNASIKYVGDYMTLTYTHSSGKTTIKTKGNAIYAYPKISYIPSERNFVSGVQNFNKYNEGNDVILYFGYDWSDAKRAISKLDISQIFNRNIVYENINDKDYVFDNGAKIALTNASSGVLSVLPLYQTILYMLSILYNKPRMLSPSKEFALKELRRDMLELSQQITENRMLNIGETNLLTTLFKSLNWEKIKTMRKLTSLTPEALSYNIQEASIRLNRLFQYHFTQLYIEEPEQNLFPETQQKFVYWLLKILSSEQRDHSAVITTHSPYILFALNNCMMGGLVKKDIPADKQSDFPSHAAWINPQSVSIFEIEEGKIRCVQDKDGIIEDNYLNQAYKKNAEEYLSLLNYYDDEE